MSAASLHSSPFKLRPGVYYQGKLLDECVVTLLTRRVRKDIANGPSAEQDDLLLLRSIVRIGNIDDPNILRTLIDELMPSDENTIQEEINNLSERLSQKPPPLPSRIKPPVLDTDSVSEPFELNPGIVVDGTRHTTCRVRLTRRGENKLIDAEPDELRANDLLLYYSIVQLGGLSGASITMEHIDLLAAPDEQRVAEEYEKLRDSFRGDNKKP